ncbi:hypothetical protein PKB33_000890 [Campylobacter lari]|nr:hypothetical protein [Campylobacter lari]
MSDMLNVASKATISSSSNKKQSYKEGVLTEVEENPWCLVDLGRNFPCSGIKIYGLKTIDNLKVEVSSDLKEWCELSVFSQNDSTLYLQILPQSQTRYIRVSGIGRMSLEFSKLEAYVTDLIVSARDDALGSRMYALVNGMIIAKKIGFNFGYVWKEINHDFQQGDDLAGMKLDGEDAIFSKKFIEQHSYNGYLKSKGILFGFKDKNIFSLKEKPYHYHWGYYAPLGYGFDDYDEKKYHNDFKSCFFDIKFAKPIDMVLQLSNDTSKNIGNFVALHLRGGDIIHGEASKIYQKACYYKVFPVEIALEIIKIELKKKINIILFGDDLYLLRELQKYSKELAKDFGADVYIVDDLIDRSKYSITQMGFYEMALMSKAQKIYRAGSSLFSRFAHAIGDAQMINIFTYFTSKERYEILKRNIGILKLNSERRKSYAYFNLYLLSIELKLDIDVSKYHLMQAIGVYKENKVFYNLYLANCYAIECNCSQLEELLKETIRENDIVFFKNLFLLYAGQTNHSEMENFLTLSKKCDLSKFPFISYVVSKIYFHRKNFERSDYYCNFASSLNFESFLLFKKELVFSVQKDMQLKLIEQYKDSWNFVEIEKIYSISAGKNQFLEEYVSYLIFTGQFKKALDALKKYPSIAQILDLSKDEMLQDLEAILQEKLEDLTRNKYRIKDDYIAAYVVTELVEQNKHCCLDLIFVLLERSILKSSNTLLKAFCIKKVIDYFFPYRAFFENNKIVILILNKIHEEFLTSIGGKIYYDILSCKVSNVNFSNIQVQTRKRVAVCIFGALRGDFVASLKNIEETIVKPLNADVFIFSWNRAYIWAGLGGNGNWVKRFFDENVVKKSPVEIRNNAGLKNMLPSVFEELSKEYYKDIKKADFKEIANLKRVCLENPDNFEKKYTTKLNRSKMWYAIYRSYQLMCEYENEKGFNYDYVVATRPDRDHEGFLKLAHIEMLKSNEILELQGHLGPAGEKFAGPRDSMKRWMCIWEYAQLNKNISFFKDFPFLKISPHQLLHNWLIVNGIRCYPLYGKDFKLKDFNQSSCIRGLKIPNIKDVLTQDLKKLENSHQRIIPEIIDFFEVLQQRNHTMVLGAVDVVKSHLSYKLGQEAIRCSKGFGYVKLPLALFWVYIKHQRKITSLKLHEYQDYKESQKIMKYFSYRLGSIILNAHKNWYKGGYIRLPFVIAKLKREFKKNRDKK